MSIFKKINTLFSDSVQSIWGKVIGGAIFVYLLWLFVHPPSFIIYVLLIAGFVFITSIMNKK